MVQDAQMKRVHAEKLLNESKMKIDVLTAEVEALKSLVLSQSPGRGATGSHLHQSRASPHNSPAARKTSLTPKAWLTNAANAANSPVKKLPFMQRRNTSEGIDDLPLSAADLRLIEEEERLQKQVDFKEVDPIFHKEFTQWRERPEIDPESPFLRRILNEEIKTCLHFDNMELASLVLEAITTNALEIELISEQKPTVKTCALSQVPRFCPFRMRVDANADWHFVSQLCRNRIAAVCDFFTYLRYLRQGLIKCGLHDAYWDVIGLRKNIALARLGLGFIPKQGVRGDDDAH
uniref:Guanine nucleotide exchange factor for Rab-3A n=1 Tax=Plectus sambesii TaxID=2011161 RepID=A0A914XMZ2_9BILA